SDGDDATSFSYPMYKDIRDRSGRVFSGVLARYAIALSVSGLGNTERATGELVSGNYFGARRSAGARTNIWPAGRNQYRRESRSHPQLWILDAPFWRRSICAQQTDHGERHSANGGRRGTTGLHGGADGAAA